MFKVNAEFPIWDAAAIPASSLPAALISTQQAQDVAPAQAHSHTRKHTHTHIPSHATLKNETSKASKRDQFEPVTEGERFEG